MDVCDIILCGFIKLAKHVTLFLHGSSHKCFLKCAIWCIKSNRANTFLCGLKVCVYVCIYNKRISRKINAKITQFCKITYLGLLTYQCSRDDQGLLQILHLFIVVITGERLRLRSAIPICKALSIGFPVEGGRGGAGVFFRMIVLLHMACK